MRSVYENNTLSEMWDPGYDSGSQWSHAPVAPVFVPYMNIAGIRPLAPGFERFEIRPQPGDLEQLDCTAHTVLGPIRVQIDVTSSESRLIVTTPVGGQGELVMSESIIPNLEDLGPGIHPGTRRYKLPSGSHTDVLL